MISRILFVSLPVLLFATSGLNESTIEAIKHVAQEIVYSTPDGETIVFLSPSLQEIAVAVEKVTPAKFGRVDDCSIATKLVFVRYQEPVELVQSICPLIQLVAEEIPPLSSSIKTRSLIVLPESYRLD